MEKNGKSGLTALLLQQPRETEKAASEGPSGRRHAWRWRL